MTTEATLTGVEVNEHYKSRMSAIDAIAGDDDDQPQVEQDVPQDQVDTQDDQQDVGTQDAQDTVDDDQQDEPRVSLKETRKLKVDGQEKEATLAEIIEAGTKALQKESAADARLAEATRLLNEAKQVKPVQLPSQEDVAAYRANEDAELTEIVQAIQVGTPEEATQALRYLMERQRTAPDQIANVANAQVQAILARHETQTRFHTTFPEVAKDSRLMALATQEVSRRLESGEPNTWETYEAAGKEIESWFKVPKADTSMAGKEQRKRTVTNLPAAGSKLPQKPEEKPETVQDVLHEMRAARKQI